MSGVPGLRDKITFRDTDRSRVRAGNSSLGVKWRRAAAHHSFAAEFDFQKPVTLKGTVVQWEMINPHGWITMDVRGEDGKTAQWMVETSNPNGLMRLGWTKRSLKPGDEITVEGYKAKDGSNTANAATVTLADGRKVFAGSSGTPAGTPGTANDK